MKKDYAASPEVDILLDTDTGHIYCQECQLNGGLWCEHIETIITKGHDTCTIWDPENEVPGLIIPVMVPIVPTAALWATCELAYSEKLQAFRVDARDDSVTSVAFIGFVNRGEARGVIRSMIVDWFRGTIDTTALECKQTAHSFRSQIRWNADMKDERKAFSQYWSVWSSGKCLGCRGTLDDFDDLVPEADPKVSPWS